MASDGAGGGDPRGGAGWLDDGAPDASRSVYRAYHLLPSALKTSTNSGHILSFELGALPAAVPVGEVVQVGYEETASGGLTATSLSYPGAVTTTGTVSSVAADGSGFAIQTDSGQSLTFSTGGDPELLQGLELGDAVQVTYTSNDGALTARSVAVTATAVGSAGGGGGYGASGGGEGSYGNGGYGSWNGGN
jgi:hypothetical protein